jgi:LysR family transcriptional activator of nhaA
MQQINYNHLYYFWIVAREGTIARASEQLQLATPTISSQIHSLERSLGERLFTRSGRRLILTEAGRVVFRYAEEMFSASRDMVDSLKGRSTGRPLRVTIGVADAMPKLLAYRLIKPALELPEPVQFVCHDGRPARLLAELALHALDIVLSDTPIGPETKVRAYNHQLGECGVSVFGTVDLAQRFQAGFPASLDGAPFLLPTESSPMRRDLDRWFEDQNLRPSVRGEVDDSALLKVFGQSGEGLFPAPSVLESEVCRQYGVKVVGRIEQVRERFYAISVERKLKHPAVIAISDAAKRTFAAMSP